MQLDKTVSGTGALTSASEARLAEEAGYDAVWVGETRHDPFLQVVQIASATSHLTVGTSVAIAFARSPMTVASSAYDLAELTEGRFVLGLGSQVKAHIERRFSMPWSAAAPRMREFVMALRAIWASWTDAVALDFQGETYTHTLMTPFFTPPRHDYGPPPVYVAGVGERLTEVAGEVADGFFFHAFTNRRYLETVTMPALARGRGQRAEGLPEARVPICGPAFVATGADDRELEAAVAATRKQIAFYASTPAYRPVLDVHGWGDLQPALTRLSKQGRWEEMAALIDDDVLTAFASVGTPEEVAAQVVSTFDGLADRLTLHSVHPLARSTELAVLRAVRSAQAKVATP